MEEEIIIVIKPRRADAVTPSDSKRAGVLDSVPIAHSFDTYAAAVKFLAANLKG